MQGLVILEQSMFIFGRSAIEPDRISKLLPIKRVLRTRRYQLIIFVSAAIYSLSYMILLGTISYYPGLSSVTDTYPIIRATSYGISIIPYPNIFMFMFYQTITFIMTSSFLVGLSIALTFYSRKLNKFCRTRSLEGAKGLFGILPAFFTSFACCGGGLMALVIGPTAFSMLAIYSNFMAPVTVAALVGGIYFMSMKISKRIFEIEGNMKVK
ncbi:MAG: hypothetical protein ACRD47_03240 [Nitrososphaeraceae archaeon]